MRVSVCVCICVCKCVCLCACMCVFVNKALFILYLLATQEVLICKEEKFMRNCSLFKLLINQDNTSYFHTSSVDGSIGLDKDQYKLYFWAER